MLWLTLSLISLALFQFTVCMYAVCTVRGSLNQILLRVILSSYHIDLYTPPAVDRRFTCSEYWPEPSAPVTCSSDLALPRLGLTPTCAPRQCVQCSRTFTVRSGLEAHMRVHRGIKLASCHICHKSFSNSSALRVHLRSDGRFSVMDIGSHGLAR